MKKLFIIFYLVLSIFLFTPNNAYAESGLIIGYDTYYAKDIYNAPYGRFYDFVNGITAVATQYGDLGYYPNPITAIETDSTGPGSAIAFDVNETFLSGFVYNIHVYLCASPTNVYPKLNTVNPGIATGSSLSSAMTNFSNGTKATILHQTNAFGSSRLTSNGNIFCGRLSYIFNPVSNGTTIFVPFQSSALSSNWTFFGYSLTNYGSSNSLSSSDIQSIIESNNSTIIGNITQAQNSINSNIDSTRNSINNTISNSTNTINNTITDDSIDTTDSNNFFNNFHTSDNGGISSVITAPLTFIRSMSDSCSPLEFTIFNQTISLPCGDTLFWNRSDVSDFRLVWNIIFGGAVVYMVLRKVFISIEEMKDPESDKVSVMDL